MVKTLELKANLEIPYSTLGMGCNKVRECYANCWQECASAVVLNEFVRWLIANEAFQLAARLITEWDRKQIEKPECVSCNEYPNGCDICYPKVI